MLEALTAVVTESLLLLIVVVFFVGQGSGDRPGNHILEYYSFAVWGMSNKLKAESKSSLLNAVTASFHQPEQEGWGMHRREPTYRQWIHSIVHH